MAFQVQTQRAATTSDLDPTIYVLRDEAGTTRAEIWPANGSNCYRWQATLQGKPCELLYADPQFFDRGRPTRTGIPVLFPFPNRLREGRFTWEGKTYQLPLNESTGKHSIHGFAFQRPWRVIAQGADQRQAWLTTEFAASQDAPELLPLWPADYRLRLTYRLNADYLRIEAEVHNPDVCSLPFGLGYHPYFKLPLMPGLPGGECTVQSGARAYWELQDGLPDGQTHPVDAARNLQAARRIDDLKLDDVFTGLPFIPAVGTGDLCEQAVLRQAGVELRVLTSPSFREMVAFTPPHGKAICLEPYTCATDAIHLHQAGLDAGLLVLPPGELWSRVVEFRLDRNTAQFSGS